MLFPKEGIKKEGAIGHLLSSHNFLFSTGCVVHNSIAYLASQDEHSLTNRASLSLPGVSDQQQPPRRASFEEPLQDLLAGKDKLARTRARTHTHTHTHTPSSAIREGSG